MQIISSSHPDTNILKLLGHLEEQSKYNLDYQPFTSQIPTFFAAIEQTPDSNQSIISCIVLYPFDDELMELNGLTHPDMRNKGYFSKLLFYAFKELSKNNIHTLLSTRTFGYSFTTNTTFSKEYLMTYNGKKIDNKLPRHHQICEYIYDYNDYSEYNYVYLSQDTPVAILKIRFFLDTNSGVIHHVMVRKKYRRNGYGKGLLIGALKMFFESIDCKLILHVSGSNIAAFNLYKNNGFSCTQELVFHAITFKDNGINN